MADKDSDQPQQSSDDEALIKRVDDMMSPATPPRNPNPAPPQGPYQPKKVQPSGVPPLKGVYKPKETSKPPIVIKLADDTSDSTPSVEKAVLDPLLTLDESQIEPLNDQKTDEAIDDIEAKESDTILAVEDVRTARRNQAVAPKKSGWKDKLKKLFKNKWTWAVIVVILLVLFGVPATRYKILGLIIKKPVTITVLDSKTNTPVSSANVQLASVTGKTDADGSVTLKAPLGKHKLEVSKQYYQNTSASYTVSFKSGQSANEKIIATGRLIPITLTNIITGKPLSGASVKIKNTIAKSDAKGQAYIAVPVGSNVLPATISMTGFNSSSVNVQVTDQAVKANDFALTPSGHVYFLSSSSGTINVVESNLDGTGRKTVLAGTGSETAATTSLLASSDWRYLVLESSRDGQPALYLIDTSNNKLTEFENSATNITLIGWSGHNFIYDLTKTSQSYWQAGREVIKSYDADNQQLNQLDTDQAEGSSSAYAYQNFDNFYIIGNEAVYSTQWTVFDTGGSYNTAGKNDTIRVVDTSGQNKKDYLTLPVTTSSIKSQQNAPDVIYFAATDVSGQTSYYQYHDQAVQTANIDSGTFSASYPTYLVSPSGSQTFWSQLQDGQTALFTGDQSGNNKKQVSDLSGYAPYGWYSNNYLLLSKNSSQLYIVPVAGLSDGQQPLKITSYYKTP